MKKLSVRQQQALDFLKQHISDHGYALTVRELAEMIGYKSSSTTHNILRKLQEKGYIKYVGPRVIEIIAPKDALQNESDLIANEISEILSKYDFPVLQDVHKRPDDSRHPGYVRQQVRYLRNVASAGLASNK